MIRRAMGDGRGAMGNGRGSDTVENREIRENPRPV